MKKTILITGLFILLLASLCEAEVRDLTKIDGHEWRTWTVGQKANFVLGFLVGVTHVINENMSMGTYSDKNYDSEKA